MGRGATARTGSGSRRPRIGAKGTETRARILEAAEAVFAERGYAGTSLDAIAARAGVHTQGIAYYFKSKESLYRGAMAEAMGVLEARTQERLTSPGSARHRVIRSIEAWVDALAERPTIARLILHEAANPNPTGMATPPKGAGTRAYNAVEQAFRELVPDAHPDDAWHFEATLAGSTLFFLAGLENLQRRGARRDAAESLARHKQLLAKVARNLLSDVRPA